MKLFAAIVVGGKKTSGEMVVDKETGDQTERLALELRSS
jgi:hypothetical protein